jgi:hypothetical protein
MSVAAGPLVTYGQQQFGSTANGGHLGYPASNSLDSFWNLGVAAGDQLTIDWEAKRGTHLQVLPVGTTDFSLNQGEPFKVQGLNPEGKNELRFTAPQTGTMPMLLQTIDLYAGPYSFTAFVKHGLVLDMPRLSRLNHVAKVKVGIHTPDGGTINESSVRVTIEARLEGRWLAIGSAPVDGASALVHTHLPHSLWSATTSIRASASGRSYARTFSSALHVSVP